MKLLLTLDLNWLTSSALTIPPEITFSLTLRCSCSMLLERRSKALMDCFLFSRIFLIFISFSSMFLLIFSNDFFCRSIKERHSSKISVKLEPKYFLNLFL